MRGLLVLASLCLILLTACAVPPPGPVDGAEPPLPAPTQTPMSPRVNRSTALRVGPGREYEVVVQAGEGDALQVTGRDPSGEWLQVALPDGAPGWLPAELVDDAPGAVRLAADIPPPPAPTALATPSIRSGIVISDVFNSSTVEHVVIANHGDEPVDLGGCHLYGSRDHPSSVDDYVFPAGFTLQPGQVVRVHSGSEGVDDPPSDVYWTDTCVWNNRGETVVLEDAADIVHWVKRACPHGESP